MPYRNTFRFHKLNCLCQTHQLGELDENPLVQVMIFSVTGEIWCMTRRFEFN
jgi:hypothetical protein